MKYSTYYSEDLKLIEERFHKLIFHRAPFAKEYENFELPTITEDLMESEDNGFLFQEYMVDLNMI